MMTDHPALIKVNAGDLPEDAAIVTCVGQHSFGAREERPSAARACFRASSESVASPGSSLSAAEFRLFLDERAEPAGRNMQAARQPPEPTADIRPRRPDGEPPSPSLPRNRAYGLGIRSLLGRHKSADKPPAPSASDFAETVIVGNDKANFSIIVSRTSGGVWLDEMEKRKKHHSLCGKGQDPIDIAVARSHPHGKPSKSFQKEQAVHLPPPMPAYPRSISRPKGVEDDEEEEESDQELNQALDAEAMAAAREIIEKKPQAPKVPRPPAAKQATAYSGSPMNNVQGSRAVADTRSSSRTQQLREEAAQDAFRPQRPHTPHKSMGGSAEDNALLFFDSLRMSPTVSVDSRMSSAATSPAMFVLPPPSNSPLLLFRQSAALAAAAAARSGTASVGPGALPGRRGGTLQRQSVSPPSTVQRHGSPPADRGAACRASGSFSGASSDAWRVLGSSAGEGWEDAQGGGQPLRTGESSDDEKEEELEDGRVGRARTTGDLRDRTPRIPATSSFAFDEDDAAADTLRRAGEWPGAEPAEQGQGEGEDAQGGASSGDEQEAEESSDRFGGDGAALHAIPPTLDSLGKDAVGSLSSRTYTDEWGIEWHKRGPLTETAAVAFHTEPMEVPRVVDRYGFVEEGAPGDERRQGQEQEQGQAGAASREAEATGAGPAAEEEAPAPVMTREEKLALLREEREVQRWRAMIGQGLSDWNQYQQRHPREAKRRIRRGVPDCLRGLVWQLLAGSRELLLLNEGAYEHMLLYELSNSEMDIIRDINRTFPNHVYFRQKHGPGQRALFNVLKAYSVYDRKIGYVQGMGFLAGLLLLYMAEEDAFWLLVALMKGSVHAPLDGLFRVGLPLVQQCLFQWERLLRDVMPGLARHLEAEGIAPSMYASQWFITAFAYNFPFATTLRIWDVFLFEGMKTVFRVGLALLKQRHDDLMQMTFEELVPALRSFPDRFLEPETLISLAVSFRVTERLRELEEEYKALQSPSPLRELEAEEEDPQLQKSSSDVKEDKKERSSGGMRFSLRPKLRGAFVRSPTLG